MRSASQCALQAGKEHRWRPVLAGQLPLAIPEPMAQGAPGCGYLWPWSVYRWLEGKPATAERVGNLGKFAADLAGFLAALYRIDPSGGPPPGEHNFFRGGPLAVYDAETRQALTALDDEIDTGRALEVWEAALAPTWHGPPVWVHGDVSVSILLVSHGRMSAVTDFGCSAAGDPACDTAMAWTFFFQVKPADVPGPASSTQGNLGAGSWLGPAKGPIVLARALHDDPANATKTRPSSKKYPPSTRIRLSEPNSSTASRSQRPA